MAGPIDFIFRVAMDISDVRQKYADSEKLAEQTSKSMASSFSSALGGLQQFATAPIQAAIQPTQDAAQGIMSRRAGVAFAPESVRALNNEFIAMDAAGADLETLNRRGAALGIEYSDDVQREFLDAQQRRHAYEEARIAHGHDIEAGWQDAKNPKPVRQAPMGLPPGWGADSDRQFFPPRSR